MATAWANRSSAFRREDVGSVTGVEKADRVPCHVLFSIASQVARWGGVSSPRRSQTRALANVTTACRDGCALPITDHWADGPNALRGMKMESPGRRRLKSVLGLAARIALTGTP
jgi:hypothetical protein